MGLLERARGVVGESRTDDDGEPTLLDRCREIRENPLTVTLSDGRDLGYADCGDPEGDPLLVFHGFPNSRVFGALFDEPGREHGLRVIAPERPGIGVSDPDPDRDLTDWPDDVVDLLDALGIDAAPILGVSGGSPYALACAALCPDRIDRAGVAVGLAPASAVGLRDRLPFLLARHATPVTRAALWWEGRKARQDPEAHLRSRADEAADVDREYWLGEVGRALLETGLEARRQGNAALAGEMAIYATPWGFDLSTIDGPVGLWYGKADEIVPAEMGRYLDRTIPTAEAHFYPRMGHISAVVENEDEIVEWLLSGG